MEFKVGDRVVGNKRAQVYSITKPGWVGEVIKVLPHGMICVKGKGHLAPEGEFNVDAACFDLVVPAAWQKVVITTEGTTTLARLYEGRKVVKSAEAKLSPEDKFDFATGAALAFDRLMGRKEKKEPEKLFPLEDIKAGYLLAVTDRKKSFYMTVAPGNYGGGTLGCSNGEGDFWPVECFGPDLKYMDAVITAVYGPAANRNLLANTTDSRELLWRRGEK